MWLYHLKRFPHSFPGVVSSVQKESRFSDPLASQIRMQYFSIKNNSNLLFPSFVLFHFTILFCSSFATKNEIYLSQLPVYWRCLKSEFTGAIDLIFFRQNSTSQKVQRRGRFWWLLNFAFKFGIYADISFWNVNVNLLHFTTFLVTVFTIMIIIALPTTPVFTVSKSHAH